MRLKYFILSIFCFIFFVSCSFNYEEEIVIINQFNNFNDNVQLCKDLFAYNYYDLLLKKFKWFKKNDIKDIKFNYEITPKEKRIVFLISLNLLNTNLNKNKKIVYSFLKEEILKIINLHVKKSDKFISAITFSLKWLKYLDENDIENLWNNCSKGFKQKTSKKDFIEIITQRNNSINILKDRKLDAKKISKSIKGENEEQNYFVLRFISKINKDKIFYEVLTIEENDKVWLVFGYNY